MEKSLKLIISNWHQPLVQANANQHPAFKILWVFNMERALFDLGCSFPLPSAGLSAACMEVPDGFSPLSWLISRQRPWGQCSCSTCLWTIRKLCHSANFRPSFQTSLNKLKCLLYSCSPILGAEMNLNVVSSNDFFPITLRRPKKPKQTKKPQHEKPN